MQSLIPFNERDRLRALHACQILDTSDEDCFDDIVARAVAAFDVPISTFALVDSERHWIKAGVGFGARETDRAVAFCSHVVANNAPMVLEDTLKYRRFAENEFVVNAPFLRFYAGVPVRATGGHPIGAFCIMDVAPRRLPWQEYLALQALAREIEGQLVIRKATT